ncbi:MAG: Gfo/Idh/MocA family oxidoreductase [Nitrospirae bacterium]|nr:MAG: Gfo/Idh/MocA family oxidoreductase [Nitrospirota bacterium]
MARTVLTIGFIGAGRMARAHAAVLRTMPNVMLKACCGRRLKSGQAFGKEFGIPEAYANYEELLARAKVDVYWVTPSVLELPTVAKACLRTCKAVFLEKPVGLSLEEAQEVADVAAQSSSIHMVGLNRRFYSNINAAVRLAEKHGRVRGIEVHAPEDITDLHDHHPPRVVDRWIYMNGVHCIDLLRYLGGEVATVTAAQVGKENSRGYAAMLKFTGGGVGQYTSHWYAPGRWRVALYADGLCCLIQPLESAKAIYRGGREEPIPLSEEDQRFKPGFYDQARYFLECIMAGKAVAHPGCDLPDYLKTVGLIDIINGEKPQIN